MKINEKIEVARRVMEKYKVDAYIVTSSDYHQREYIDDYFKGRQYLSGFTGSAGILVIFKDEACLWTDGRYHLQAENQLAGTEIKLFKQGNISIPTYKEYIISKLKEIIIKEQHNCKATGYWKTNSIKYNFLLIAHEYLFIFKK